MFVRIAAGLALAGLSAAAVGADEAWTSDLGPVVYETDIGETAVFSLTHVDTGGQRIYLPFLATSLDARVGLYEGYWIASDTQRMEAHHGRCEAGLVTADGQTSWHWGRILLEFDQAGFPTGFAAMSSYCLGEMTDEWRAEPVTGDAGK